MLDRMPFGGKNHLVRVDAENLVGTVYRVMIIGVWLRWRLIVLMVLR